MKLFLLVFSCIVAFGADGIVVFDDSKYLNQINKYELSKKYKRYHKTKNIKKYHKKSKIGLPKEEKINLD